MSKPKEFVFLSGIGRSGSTVLASVLSQNPNIYVTPTSPLLDLLCFTEDSWRHKINQSRTHAVEHQLENIYKGIIQGTWAHIDKPLIIDKHRTWPRNKQGIQQMFGIDQPKIICTVRNVAACVASFITLIEKNKGVVSSVDQLLIQKKLPLTLENRCECIWVDFLQNVYESLWIGWNECRDNILLLDYEEITGQTDVVLKRIYDFIGQPTDFVHDLNQISNSAPENDIFWGFNGLHDIRPKMEKTACSPESILSDQVHRFSGMEFWRNHEAPKRMSTDQLIQCQPKPKAKNVVLQKQSICNTIKTCSASTIDSLVRSSFHTSPPEHVSHTPSSVCLKCPSVEFSSNRQQYRCKNAKMDQLLDIGIHGFYQKASELSHQLMTDYPHCHRIAFNEGWYQIAKGHLQKGFELLDRGRWEHVFGSPPLGSGRPLPKKQEDLTGKTVLLRGEGGLGDEIINVRFAEYFAQQGARVIVSCSESLRGVFSRVKGVSETVPHVLAVKTPHDYWVPAMSALRFTEQEWNHLSGDPYLTVNLKRNEHWGKLLPKNGMLKIGLKWSGNPLFEHEQHRLFPAELMIQLSSYSKVKFYSLQKERSIDLPATISDLSPLLTDWEETAAAISQLDLVITSCTSIAHMAAALGKPTWIVIPLLPYYLWAMPGDTSPWYHSVRLFRQTEYDHWESTFEQIKHALVNKCLDN